MAFTQKGTPDPTTIFMIQYLSSWKASNLAWATGLMGFSRSKEEEGAGAPVGSGWGGLFSNGYNWNQNYS